MSRYHRASEGGEIAASFENAYTRRSFLTGLEKENNVPVERHIQTFQIQCRHESRHDIVFVVHRSPAVYIAAVACCGEWRKRPLPDIDAHYIGMCHDEQRPLASVSLQSRYKCLPFRGP